VLVFPVVMRGGNEARLAGHCPVDLVFIVPHNSQINATFLLFIYDFKLYLL
jgi:hypothetical protein